MEGMNVSEVKFPVCITFTPEGEKALGIERPIDRVLWAEKENNLERSPEADEYTAECVDELECDDIKCLAASPQICAKLPSGEQVVKVLGLTTAIFEGGKRAVIAIMDFIDVCKGGDGKQKCTHNLMAVQVPEEMEELFNQSESGENIRMIA